MKAMIGERELEKITLEHLLKVKRIEDETCLLLKDRTENLISRILLRINEGLKNAEIGKQYDGCYYTCLELQKIYKNLTAAMNGLLLEAGDDNQDLLKWLWAVQQASEEIPTVSDNPIVYERMVLLNGGILRIKQRAETLMDTESVRCELGNSVHRDNLLEMIHTYMVDFFRGALPEIQGLIEEVMVLMSSLEEGKKYHKICRDHKEVFEALTAEWVDWMEGAGRDSHGESALPVARDLERILDLLKDADAPVAATALPEVSEIIDMRQVEGLVRANLLGDETLLEPVLKKVDQANEESVTEVREIMKEGLSHIFHDLYQQLDRESSGYGALSKEMTLLFKQTVKSIGGLKTVYISEQGQAIAAGVKTTMQLKADSLSEKNEAYLKGKEAVTAEMENRFAGLMEDCLSEAESIFEDKLKNSDQQQTRAERRFYNGLEKLKAMNFEYDRTYLAQELLFELRTFDELANHSMKKLIELEPERAESLMAIVTDAVRQSRNRLMAHQIELIAPEPHDPFDGKLHEVLMAESSEDFTKGEIIRTSNVGYQLKEHIILRASVIAAR